MRSLGANYQSIRLTLGDLSFGHSGVPAPGFLRELQNMVRMAAHDGIYSEFKFTVYGKAGFDWTAFWLNPRHEQTAYIRACENVWRLFANNPAVIGYDVLNEPSPGALHLTPAPFEAVYLNPFYRRMIAALRRVDRRHIALFQPLVVPGFGPLPYLVPLHGAQIAYAPHFYPPHPYFTTRNYLPLMQRFLAEAGGSHVPIMIGEYGTPWDLRDSRNGKLELMLQGLEAECYRLFLRFGVSYSRPWFADDRVHARGLNGQSVTWSLITTTRNNLGGPLRPWIVIPFVDAAERLLSAR